jgi:DNA-binding CsgD family transcriptional regulator
LFHLLFVLYIVAIGIAVGPILTCLLLYRKGNVRAYLSAAFLFGGGSLLLASDGVKMYASFTIGSPVPSVLFFALACTVVGTAMMTWAIPSLAFQLVNLPMPRGIHAVRVILFVLFQALGAVKELFPSPLPSALHGVSISIVYCGFAGFVLANFNRLEDRLLRSLMRTMLYLLAGLLVLMIAQGVLEGVLDLPTSIKLSPLAQLIFQLTAGCTVMSFAVRYFAAGTGQSPDDPVPQAFLSRFSISSREQDIIVLMLQGLGNREIGERLFISAQTVKNHVYNIYRKTGVANKVQLVNLLRSTRES